MITFILTEEVPSNDTKCPKYVGLAQSDLQLHNLS